MDNNIQRKTIILLEGETEEILDGEHNEFYQVESTLELGDMYRLIFRNKFDEYFETTYRENIEEGLYYQQSYAEQVFPKERKVTVIVYE